MSSTNHRSYHHLIKSSIVGGDKPWFDEWNVVYSSVQLILHEGVDRKHRDFELIIHPTNGNLNVTTKFVLICFVLLSILIYRSSYRQVEVLKTKVWVSGSNYTDRPPNMFLSDIDFWLWAFLTICGRGDPSIINDVFTTTSSFKKRRNMV